MFEKGSYGLRYVVKSVPDWSFSESANFRDFLVVLEKGVSPDQWAMVYLKRRLRDLSTEEASLIAETVRAIPPGVNRENDDVQVIWRHQDEVRDSWQDMGALVVFNTEAGDRLGRFYEKTLAKPGNKLVTLSRFKPVIPVSRGITPWTTNLLNLLFIVRNFNPKRAERSVLVLHREDGEWVEARVKDTQRVLRIPKGVTRKGLKTPSYLPRLDVSELADIAVTAPFPHLTEAMRLTRVKELNFDDVRRRTSSRSSHLVINRRFNFTAPGIKVVACFSEDTVLAGEAFWVLPASPEVSRAICVWLNSAFSIIELLLLQRETQGSFIDITSDNIKKLHLPSAKASLNALSEVFHRIKDMDLPPLFTQFENPPEARLAIDRCVLELLGYPPHEVDSALFGVYDALAKELKSFKELMSAGRGKKNNEAQLPLLG